MRDARRLSPLQERALVIAADSGDEAARRGWSRLPARDRLGGPRFSGRRGRPPRPAAGGRGGPAVRRPALRPGAGDALLGLRFLLGTQGDAGARRGAERGCVPCPTGRCGGSRALRAARDEHERAHGAEPTVAPLSGATGFSAAQLEQPPRRRAARRAASRSGTAGRPGRRHRSSTPPLAIRPASAPTSTSSTTPRCRGARPRRPARRALARRDPRPLRAGPAGADPQRDRRRPRPDGRAGPADRGRSGPRYDPRGARDAGTRRARWRAASAA